MTLKEKELKEKVTTLIDEIEDYISSNSDWVYYFMNPFEEGNEYLFDCMKAYQDNWKEYISFRIISITTCSVTITINILDETELGINLNRRIYLPKFAEIVERNKKLYDGKFNEIRIKQVESDIVILRNRLLEEEELKILKSN